MTILIIFIVVYLLSAFGFYKFIQLAHYHPEGRWTIIEPNSKDKFITFCPILNTFMCICAYSKGWRKDRSNNFFKPKNK